MWKDPVILLFLSAVTVCESFQMCYQERRASAGIVKATKDFKQEETSRRSAVIKILGASLLSVGTSLVPKPADAYSVMDPVGIVQSDKSDASILIDQTFSPEARVTHKVTFNVRISRADGTFYVRDDPPDTVPSADNQVFYGELVLGLFGEIAPTHVERFLKYADVQYTPADDDPLPSYARSSFQSLDQTNGLLQGGYIPGLHLTSLGGSSALEYGGKILPAALWIEKGDAASHRVSHAAGRGLLTHRNLEVLPIFGVTTRPLSDFDGTHTVFGQILPTESSNTFLSRVIDLPTYSTDRPTIPVENVGGADSRAVGEVASSVYSLQKEFFRGAAKSFGDTRLSSVYEGKILRRVEVTAVTVQKS